MPRKADKQLEGRIVDAAYQLWSKGGEHAVTMRAVALAAKTTTPTLYERFRDKHDLIVFMRVRARERMFAALQAAKSSVEVCRLGLEFAIANGNEYLLLTSDWAERLRAGSRCRRTSMSSKSWRGTSAEFPQTTRSLRSHSLRQYTGRQFCSWERELRRQSRKSLRMCAWRHVRR